MRLTEVQFLSRVIDVNISRGSFGGAAQVVGAVFNTPDPIIRGKNRTVSFYVASKGK